MPTEVKGEARRHMLFSYIVQETRNVSIAPLEYCGNAHLVRIGSSDVVAPCYGDPSLPEYHAIRDLKNRILPPALPGTRHPKISASVANELQFQIGEYVKSVSRKRALDGNENESPQTGGAKPKRKCLSADKRMASMSGS
ncbi:hypothetical protein K438DRAFT_1779580 [Mycena galopus ATCC 62051]|nr:hypothetical protein K438DRAFT_1779580 [Mycena galopus ATCC 62051]